MTRLRYSQMLMAVVALAVLAGSVIAEVPGVINYQGRLTDSLGNPVTDGQYDLTFRIWSTPEGSMSLPLWIGDQQAVQVTNGLLSCQVGPIPSSVFTASAERYLGITVGSGDEMEPRTQLISVPYAYHAAVADSTTTGTGWKYDGNYVCMEHIDDSVLIGTDTAKGKLTVYNNSINCTGVLGHGAAGVYGETFYHLASGVLGMNRQNFSTGSLGGPYCGVSGTNGGNPDISAGCFSGLVEVNNGTIEVGGHLEDFAGTILTVRDDDNEGYAGVCFGQDSDNRGWMAYDNEDDYIYWGTKENGSFSPSTLTFKNGNVGIGGMPPDTVSLYVYDIYNLSLRDEWGFGVRSYIINTGADGKACGGSFYASGSYAAYGVRGEARNASYAVGGDFYSDNIALRATAEGGGTIAGQFKGNVNILGLLSKSGGSFKIDHPLDPENKYLQHSFVESPDMMNIYNGNITTDANGDAEVILPDYFEVLNMDFRYQLTVIGTFAQAIIAEKIQDGKFTIKTDKPNVEVSWQVTGIRQDPWAIEHRIQVEMEKDEDERGYYIAPELYGLGKEKGVGYKHHKSMSGNKN